MANSLNMDIAGQIVVLRADAHLPEFRELPDLLFAVSGGYGAEAGTIGRKVFGRYVVDQEESVIDGYQIERLATFAECWNNVKH